MDNETQERFHQVDLTLNDHKNRQDGFERLLKEQSQAFKDFKDMVNGWAKRFAYLAIGAVLLSLDDQTGASLVLSMVTKVFGL